MTDAVPRNSGSPFTQCMRIARGQHGTISREQILGAGVSDDSLFRRVRKGELERLLPGIFAVAGSSPTRERRLMAAQLWIGANGALSHRTAAAILRLEGFPRGGAVELTVKGRRKAPKNSGLVLHHDTRSEPGEIIVADGFRITNPSRTLLDLAASVTEAQLEIAIEDALRRHLTSIPKLEWVLATRGGQGRPGSKALRKALGVYRDQGQTDSHFEVLLFKMLRDARVPLPVQQHEVWEQAEFFGRLDLAYPERKLAIEADGFRWHSGRQAWRRDRVKWNDLIKLGWRIYKVTPDDLRERRMQIVNDLRSLLGIDELFD